MNRRANARGVPATCGAALLLGVASSNWAGSLDAPAPPDGSAGAMYGIEDIYRRLNAGTAGTVRSGPYVEPAAGPSATGHTLSDVMNKAPAQDAVNGAAAGQVLSGKGFWGLLGGSGWGPQTGTMTDNGAVTLTPGSADQPIPAGYHNGGGKVSGDANLTPDNVRAGTPLFGVTGGMRAVIPMSPIRVYTGDGGDGDMAANDPAAMGDARAGADQRCLANRPAGYTHHRAMVCISDTDNVKNMPTTLGLPADRPVMFHTMLLAQDWNELLQTVPLPVAPLQTGGGAFPVAFLNVQYWSGCEADGTVAHFPSTTNALNCRGWTASSGDGRWGDPAWADGWLSGSTSGSTDAPCAEWFWVYCAAWN